MTSKMLLVRIAAIAFVCLCAANVFAQGSTYNFIGFGLPVHSSDPAIEALGGTAAALRGSRVVNDINPADWTWLSRTRFGFALDANYNSAKLGELDESQHSFGFQGITFGVPFWSEHSAALALGYVALTNAAGEIVQGDSSIEKTYVRKGGANMLFLGAAVRPLDALAVGARVDLIAGNIRHQDRLAQSADTAEYERDYFFNGLRPTIGFQFIGDSVSDGLKGLVIGASFSLSADLTSTKETIITPTSSPLDTTIDESGSGTYPSSLVAGISYKLSPRYRAEADYASQDFTGSSPYTSSGIQAFAATNRISFGVERLPNVAGEFGTSFGLDRWALRLGFSFAQLPYLTSTGEQKLSELALSAGAGIPLGNETMLNFSVTAGQRAPADAAAAPKENFIRLGAGVSLSDKWFVPLRRE